MSEEMITITKKEYDRLIEVDEWMDALEAAGVDNFDLPIGWKNATKKNENV